MRSNELYMKLPRKDRNDTEEGMKIETALGLRSIACGEKKCNSGEMESENSVYHRLCFVSSGNGFLTQEDKQYIIQENMAFLLCPHRKATCQAGLLYPWNYIWIDLDGQFCESLLESAGLTEKTPVVYMNKTLIHLARSTIINLSGYNRLRPGDTLRKASSLLELFAWMEDNASQGAEPGTIDLPLNREARENSKGMEYVEYIEGYFHSHMSEKIRMDTLASELGMDPSYMSHIYKSIRGISPHQYLTSLRMATGKQQLETTNKPVGDIAAMCGYENPLIFSKAFHKNVGCSPRDYRKKTKNSF